MSKSDKICNVSASESDDGVCEVNDTLQNMSIADNNSVSICANYGKEGANNVCNKCKQVRYCKAACKKKHRHKHKNDCEEHVRQAAELHDKELFKEPPMQHGDCPIFFLRIPTLYTGRRYYNCCGKEICSGCCYAPVYDSQGNEVDNHKCPYCRTPWPSSDEEIVRRFKNRMKAGDPVAMCNLGVCYRDGVYGFPQDYTKALELFHRSAGLGYAPAYLNIGYSYQYGEGVEVDKKKANHYYELAAMMGDEASRHTITRTHQLYIYIYLPVLTTLR